MLTLLIEPPKSSHPARSDPSTPTPLMPTLIGPPNHPTPTLQVDLAAGGRFHTHTASLPEGCFASEAVFVPRSGSGSSPAAIPATAEGEGEDDGYLLFYVYDRHRGASDLVVLDARDVQRWVWRVGTVHGAFGTSPHVCVTNTTTPQYRPPLAVVRLPVRVPYSYHGAWTPRTFGLEQRRGA